MTFRPLIALLASSLVIHANPPRDTSPVEVEEWPKDYRLHLKGPAQVILGHDFTLKLPEPVSHDIAVEHPANSSPVLRVWSAGKLVRGPEEAHALTASTAKDFPDTKINFGEDFTVLASFKGNHGSLFSKCSPTGKWNPNAKAMFIREGHLVYDIGWLGQMSGGPAVNDGKEHTAVVSVTSGKAKLWLDGKIVAEEAAFTKPDEPDHVFKIGKAAPNFAGAFTGGQISALRVWQRGLETPEIRQLFKNKASGANTPDFAYTPDPPMKPKVEQGSGWVQKLEQSDHQAIVSQWNAESLAEGAAIYKSLCVVCHGTKEAPGSLPTAPRFAEGMLKNGADPYSMYQTLTKGYGQMVAQPQYTTAQKYAVIQYIRETFFKPHNPSQYAKFDIAHLPRGLTKAVEEKADTSLPPYQLMELGNSLFWTFEVEAENIAQKGIAIRLDAGAGGVTKGRAWMTYDHDTLRLAAATTGSFVDWKGIAFDGSHGSHTALTGEKHLVLPAAPGWSQTDFADTRAVAKDGKRYGPMEGLRFLGLYKTGEHCVLAANIYGTSVLESPSWLDYGATPVFVRTLNLGQAKQPLRLRVAPTSSHVVLRGQGTLTQENGYWIATLAGGDQTRLFISKTDAASLETLAKTVAAPLDLSPLTKGGPAQWSESFETTSIAGSADGPFAADDFPLPHSNRYQSWLRPGGFDFTPDGKAAVVAMWNGDIWRVEGLLQPAPAKLNWRRIASGLFQPLGVKFRGQELFVTCRDQLAKLEDLNGDGETDFISCFNDDAEVTEHFHEFAMGLQTDAAGNFYYAKSGRHALDSVVPQHGTLLKVSADGSKTEILATGFRAANGVCVNDDGTFFVTDQEGFWTPKNRINRVKPGGFYGNMYGYTSVTDTSDAAMEPPLVWVTNAKDRSPAELLWVPEGAWGNLSGSLLNLSYGTGKVFLIPHEQVGAAWQGAVCELPLPAFATGIMRGRFAADGNLYTCGMFAWAGNATDPGGFHRVRRTPIAASVPLKVQAKQNGLEITFSDALATAPENCRLKVWSLKRSKNYGSKHFDERDLSIEKASLSEDKKSLKLEIANLPPTQCYELTLGEHVLHGTIHTLSSR
jgi:glucose/arabinose dehydrogenase/mono/diheme cytochrome c family protein